MICLTPKPNECFFVYRIQLQRKKVFYRKKRLYKEKWGVEDWTKNEKKKAFKGFF